MPEHQKSCSPPSIVFFAIKSAALTLLDASELRPKCFVPERLKSKRFEDYAVMIMMIYRKAAFTTLPRIQSVFIIGHRIAELTAVQLLKACRRLLDHFSICFCNRSLRCSTQNDALLALQVGIDRFGTKANEFSSS